MLPGKILYFYHNNIYSIFAMMMRYFVIPLLLSLYACSSTLGLRPSNGQTELNPIVDLTAVEQKAYRTDLNACQKQAVKQYEGAVNSSNAIVELRRCLINKGYVLLN